MGENVVLRLVSPAYIHPVAAVSCGKLVPEAFYSVFCRAGVVEVGVCQIEPHVLYARHHTASGVSLRQVASLIHGRGVELYRHRVHAHRVAPVCLYASHLFCFGKHVEPVERYVGYAYVALLCQQAASVGGKQTVSVACRTHEGAYAGSLSGVCGCRAPCRLAFHVC